MLIEDVACPVDKLADMTVDLVEMFKKFGYADASCFGHALEGNLHLVFSQVPARPPKPYLCSSHPSSVLHLPLCSSDMLLMALVLWDAAALDIGSRRKASYDQQPCTCGACR